MSARVLLITEDPWQAEVYADLVRGLLDCHLDRVASSGCESAPESILSGKTIYDLIVVDTTRDSAGSISCLRWLEIAKRVHPASGVLLVDGESSVERAVSAMKGGADDYFVKPVRPEVFQAAVRRALDRRAVFAGHSDASSYLKLIQACQLISAAPDQASVLRVLKNYFARELGFSHSAHYRVQEKELQAIFPDEALEEKGLQELLELALLASGAKKQMVDVARAPESGKSRGAWFVERGSLTPSLFIFSIPSLENEPIFLVGLSPELPVDPEEFLNRLKLLRAQLEVSSKTIAKYEGVQNLVYVDDATGLYNTRYLEKVLDREIARHELTQEPFAVLFIDADRFKSVNDTHGHWIGTRLLNELGDEIQSKVREKDVVFRYGGDEFIAVLSGCDLATAREVAERIRASVEGKVFLEQETQAIRFTVSIGVAVYPIHAKSRREIVETADRAMYSAKRHSRNSVFIATEGEVA